MNKKICVVTIFLYGFTEASAQELKGSPDSIAWQYLYAESEQLIFLPNREAVYSSVENGALIDLRTNANLKFFQVSYPYVLPTTSLFTDWFGGEYRRECHAELVVTSAVRPRDEQPPNAHSLSVHPTGMSVDLRVPSDRKCRLWFERLLLSLETQKVLDVTLETNPWHYHVAIFPTMWPQEYSVAQH